jgi:glycosyltransferase involved in cell wall biosynthesis
MTSLRAATRKASRILRTSGIRGLVQRAARVLYHRVGASGIDEPLLDDDIADSTTLDLPVPETRPTRGSALRIGWVMVPPSGGSGGHTTLFRMIAAFEDAGHTCVIFLYDRYGGDIREQEAVIRRWWPNIRAEVRSAAAGIDGVDACVASGWESAHVIARRATDPMRRLYFIQDYEPFFYPHGPRYAFAEDSYRFGFRCIALGEMVAGLLHDELDVDADVAEFGCDTSSYHLLGDRARSGVVFFARPEYARRGYWLGRVALQRFHERYPDVPVHIYGDDVRDLGFPAVHHGKLTPAALNELYNSVVAGLCLSFTNVSLVPEEMLAAGVVPVVNDSAYSRAVLGNEHLVWSSPTPDSLATALGAALTTSDSAGRARAVAASVTHRGWARAQGDVLRIVEDEVYGPRDAGTHG